jgi:F-type H+-transporting ATPase subunit delta
MRTGRIANRYAKALFELAIEKNALEEVYKDALNITDLVNNVKELRQLLLSSVIPQPKKTAVFKEIFGNSVHQVTMSFLLIIITKRRENIVLEVVHEFIELYKVHKNIVTVHLKTASKMDSRLYSEIKERMEKELKLHVELIETVVPDLLGGFVITYNDKQYDASIRKNIIRLKKEYNINIYESKF